MPIPPSTPRPNRSAAFDLAALALILIAVIVLVVLSNDTTSALATAGATTALCYRTWRGHTTENRNDQTYRRRT
ncbi:hypothetical protein ACQPZ2_00760 [Nocardia pseudovaccinii]|uniref:hypothetical protein n=1 Tax=Nocardia pseudovaccinii TaxID=189540 RepID=UPI003D920EBE